MLALIVVILISYLIGSIPSSIWVGKFMGVDIRDYGSGNAGATNTFRILGWKPGVTVLLIDLFKGFVCSFWVSQLAYQIASGPISIIPNWEVDPFLQILCGVIAILGHMFPILANFDGGKGMATATGMLVAIEPISIAIAAGVFLIVMLTTRYVSLASLVAAFIYPLVLLLLRYGFEFTIDGSILIFGAVAGIGIIIKHLGNIRRLINGTENKVGSFKPAKGWLNKEQKKSAT
jgi:glycerol-3-phosphate acyltransferase PlsY